MARGVLWLCSIRTRLRVRFRAPTRHNHSPSRTPTLTSLRCLKPVQVQSPPLTLTQSLVRSHQSASSATPAQIPTPTPASSSCPARTTRSVRPVSRGTSTRPRAAPTSSRPPTGSAGTSCGVRFWRMRMRDTALVCDSRSAAATTAARRRCTR